MSKPANLDLLVDVPSGSALVRDYVRGEASAVDFYGAHYGALDAYREKAEEVDARFDRDARARAAEAMVAPDGADAARLERFVEDGGYVVTTGQQPGLLGGPLYNVHKALTAVRVAEALEDALSRPVLPLFWVASEDHDWAEANHVHVIGVDNELHEFAVTARDAEVHPPLHRIPLGPDVGPQVAGFVEQLPETDFSAEYAELLRSAYRPGTTLPEGFHAVLRRLFSAFGLYVTDAAHPVVKDVSRETLLNELRRSGELEGVLADTARSLEEGGFEVQVPILPEGVDLFLEGPAGRERLYRENGGFRLRTSGDVLSEADVLERVERDPAVLSPNVLLRPVVESVVFPTLSYVGGPGEVAYFGQLARYFEAFGVRMPVVHPRFGATPVEAKIRKVLDKFGVDVEALRRPFHEVAAELARDEMPDGVRAPLGALRGAVGKGMGEVQGGAVGIDPTLKGPVQHARGQLFGALDELEKKVLQAIKRENEIALQQLEKAQLHLFPLGRPAERVQSAFYYLFRYGDAVLHGLHDAFQVNFR